MITIPDVIRRKEAIDALLKAEKELPYYDGAQVSVNVIKKVPSAQPEDYTELKREFILMASYIDVLLECSDEQKETLLGFISRLSEYMPWNERD